jgi:hypothetical protein
VLADNLRRGASFNAIEILKYIMNSLVWILIAIGWFCVFPLL